MLPGPIPGRHVRVPAEPPLGRKPKLVCHRLEPAATTAAFLRQIILEPPPKLTMSDKRALAHALDATTNLAQTAGQPDSPVRPRTDGTQIHMVTTTLDQDGWHHHMEINAVVQTA